MKLHGNAALSLNKRRLLCRRVVEEELSLTEAAAEGPLGERRGDGDPVEAHAQCVELGQGLLVDGELVGADGREGQR